MKVITTKNGFNIKVSDCDFDYLSQFIWEVYDRYADAHIGGRTVKMHRLILNAKETEHIDHISGDTIDNTRENIRRCSRFQNQQNRKINTNNKTGCKGVHLMNNGKYRVRVQAFGQRVSLGCFDNLNDAVDARNKKAKELHNEFYREK